MEYGWRKAPELEADEQVAVRKAANRAQGARSVGGRLTVTDRRLIFKPTLLDSILAGRAWSVNLDEVVEIGAAARGGKGGPFGGGMRRRLRVRASDGSEELFVVNGLDDLIRDLAENGLPADSAGG